MDLFCQKCSKPLELHESLLDIDQSIFMDKDQEDVLELVKILQEKLSTPSSKSTLTSESSSSSLTAAMNQTIGSITSPTGSASSSSSNLSSTFTPSINYNAPISASYSVAQNDKSHLSKFKSGFFRRREPSSNQLVGSKSSQSQLQIQSSSGSTLNINTSSADINSQQTQQQPIAINNGNNIETVHTGTSPSSFGTLSQHRMSTSSSSSSSNLMNNINNSSNNNSNSNNNNSINGSSNILKSNNNNSNTASSSSYEGDQVALSIISNERPKSVKPNNNSSSNGRTSLKSSSTVTSPTISNSSSGIPNNPNFSRTIHSPQQKSLSKLKYLRSNSKSLSLASLPKFQSALELSISPPANQPQPQRVINNPMSPPVQHNNHRDHHLSQPPQHYTTTPNTPLQQPNNPISMSSSIISPIGSPPFPQQQQQQQPQQQQQAIPPSSLKYLKALSLFRFVTELTNTDIPLCVECSKLTAYDLEDESKQIGEETIVYQSTLDTLCKQEESQEDLASLDKQILKLEEEERFYFSALEKVQNERQHLSNIASDLQKRKEQLDSLEERYWSSYSEHQRDANRLIDDQVSIVTQTGVAIEKLRRLKETNILNDAFHLWYDGHFGTINGLRLGRLQSQPVEWNEINSAWGLAISLLDNLAKRLNYKFKQFKLIPNGSTSKIEDIVNKAVYELYGSSDISLGRLFWYGRFDNGMVSFLQCLKELTDHVKTTHDPDFEVPYTIENGYINRMLIKMQFTDEDTWTKALKYMLTNLKWLLSWVAKNESTQPMNINVKRSSSSSPSSSTTNQPSNVSTPSSLNNNSNNNSSIIDTSSSTNSINNSNNVVNELNNNNNHIIGNINSINGDIINVQSTRVINK